MSDSAPAPLPPRPAPAPAPAETAAAQISVEQARADIAAQAEQRELARLQQEKEAANQAYLSSLNTGYNNALNYGTSRLGSAGIQDDYGLMDAYRAELDMIKGQVPVGDPNAASYFGTGVWDTVYNREQDAERQAMARAAQSFMGYGFEEQAFADSADDQYIADIIQQQYDDALAQLETAQARGTLNEAAWNYARPGLDTMNTAALSRGNAMGLSVLDDYRSQLTTRAAGLQGQIDNWGFGDAFDVDTARSIIEGDIAKYGARMEGDILNLIGDTQFFDVASLMGKAGSRAGITGTNTMPLIGASPTTTQDDTSRTSNDPRRKTVAGITGAF